MIASGSLRRRLLSASALAGVLSIAPGVSQAGALPGHGHYISGHGSINKANQSLTVKQSSTTGIIDWSSFSVGKNNSVTFRNGAGATLNRVTGGNLSTIAGSMHATGSLYLMNNAGVIVSGTGRVVTGGSFVATSGNIGTAFGEDGRFKAGAGKVIDKGTIVSGGATSLVGSDVRDNGTIRASAVNLQATHKLSIDGAITAKKSDGGGGLVTARGKTIVIGTDGKINASASGPGQTGGTISVVARGTATVAGALTAKGGQNGTGGFVETSGKRVHVADSAEISTLAAHGKTGTWLIDPQDFTIAASGGDITGATLTHNLASDNVLIKSSQGAKSGNGDIFVDDSISWSSSQTLTLDAYRNIEFNAPVTIKGAGNLVLIDGDQAQTGTGNAADGDLIFGSGNIAFTKVVGGNTKGSLTIDGTAYTLVNSVSQLAGDILGNAAGYYALAKNYNANADGTYASSPIPTTFSGTFEGLGNSIANLSINDATTSDFVGLFSEIGSGGIVRDIALTNVNIMAADSSTTGALAGTNDGAVLASSVSGTVYAGADYAVVGGLVGANGGTMTSDSSSAAITIGDASIPQGDTAEVGGLVGDNNGTLSYSYATGAVADTTAAHTSSSPDNNEDADLGGLVGNSSGTVSYSYATGPVTGVDTDYSGGLVGYIDGGTVSHSYATGNVVAASGKTGGFAGESSGTLSYDYATGSVTGGAYTGGLLGTGYGGTVAQSFATGAVSTGSSGADVGGLIGYNDGTAVSTSYASGAVTFTSTDGDVGGLVGSNDIGSVTTSFATNTVTGGDDSNVGGLIGSNEVAVSYSYATGRVSGGADANVGGFVGENTSDATIDESYSIGKATGSAGASVGGFAGENDNTNGISASVGDYYNKGVNGSGAIGVDNATTASDVHGLTASQMRTASSFSEWTDFGTTGGGSGWVIVDQDGSLNNAGGVAGGTTPMLLAEYSTSITDAHQLQLMVLDSTATYTLANDIDAGGTAGGDVWSAHGFIPVAGNSSPEFSGTLDGMGKTISDLTINDTADYYVGLFGQTEGAIIENVALTNVNIESYFNVGGFMGNAYGGSILNSSVSGTITDTSSNNGNYGRVGGLMGLNSGATISDSHADVAANGGVGGAYVGGLVGVNDGTISQSYASGGVTGEQTLGGLVGENEYDAGMITLSYATGAVTSTVGDTFSGGLAGVNEGGISQSYATGAVSTADGAYAGGLTGDNGGTVTQSFATGAVSGGTYGFEGGLTGYNNGSISQSYATGNVNIVFGTAGGFVGLNDGTIDQSYSLGGVAGSTTGFAGGEQSTSSITNSYWDTDTSRTTSDGASSGTTGLTTAQLQAALPTGFDSSVWKTVAGVSFPYLSWQFSGTPQVVTGKTLSGFNGTGVSGISVSLVDDGNTLSSALTGGNVISFADGTYYFLLAPGSIAKGDQVLAYRPDAKGASFFENAKGSISGLDIDRTYLSDILTASSLSTAYTDLDTALGSNASAISATDPLANTFIDSMATNFDLDAGAGGTTLVIEQQSGSVTQSVNLNATDLLLLGNANYTLTNSSNSFSTLAMQGSGSLDVTDNHALTIGSVAGVNGVDVGGGVGITTTTGNLAIKQLLEADAHPMTLTSAGSISESGSGAIDATTLSGSSDGEVALNGANVITNLGAFSIAGNHGFALTDDHDLTMKGAVNAGTGGLTLTTAGNGHDITIDSTLTGGTVDLVSAATIGENSSGEITAAKLIGSSVGSAQMTSAGNTITDLGAFTSGGAFELTDAHALTVDGTVNAGAHAVKLTTKGAGHAIAIDATLEGGTVDLVSAGAITENSSGVIDATTLEGSSVGATTLSRANDIAMLDGFASGGNFVLSDAASLTVNGTVNAASGNATLKTTGSGHNIAITKRLTAKTVKLVSAGTITENSSGAIDATTLTGSSVGATTLSRANVIADLSAFATGGFALTDDHALTTTGTVNTGSGPLKITTGSGDKLAIDSLLKTTGTMTLVSGADVTENASGGVIDAHKLNVSAQTGIQLTSPNNDIAMLGTDTTVSGPDKIKGVQ